MKSVTSGSLLSGELSPDRFHKEFLQFDQHVKQYSVSKVGIEYEEEESQKRISVRW